MIFVANLTNKELTMKCEKKGDNYAELVLGVEGKTASIVNSKEEKIIKAMMNRYKTPKVLKFNPSKESIVLQDCRIRAYADDSSLHVSATVNPIGENEVKNTIVLVMTRGSKFFTQYVKGQIKKREITPLDSYIIVKFHIKTFDWSRYSDEKYILVKTPDGTPNWKLKLGVKYTTIASSTDKVKKNDLEMIEYAGEFPVEPSRTPTKYGNKPYSNNKPYNKSSDGEKKPYRPYNKDSKPSYKSNGEKSSYAKPYSKPYSGQGNGTSASSTAYSKPYKSKPANGYGSSYNSNTTSEGSSRPSYGDRPKSYGSSYNKSSSNDSRGGYKSSYNSNKPSYSQKPRYNNNNNS